MTDKINITDASVSATDASASDKPVTISNEAAIVAPVDKGQPELSRRGFIKAGILGLGALGIYGIMPAGLSSRAWAAGSDAPEKSDLTIGFIPLTDCASVVMAGELGLFKKYGLNVTVSKEASWAAVRDKLMSGDLDAAHLLYGLAYGVSLGIAGQQKDMAVLMGINHNGQAITLSNGLKEKGAIDGPSLKKLIDADQGKNTYTFAQTFPTGTHAMWLYYWLGANGIHPFNDVKAITVPPPQMVANMRVGNMDGFCVGEPWGGRAIFDKIGFTGITSQGIWKDHPEKVLGTTLEFVQDNPNTTRAMMSAVLEASQYLDVLANRNKAAGVIASKSYVNCPEEVILGRMLGDYDDGNGKTWKDPDYMKFYSDGEVNYPYVSHGVWFLTQLRRWGLLKEDIDYIATAKKINQTDLYTEVAKSLNIPVPASPMKVEKLFDGVEFDATKAAEYAAGFKVKV